ncbi:xyloglucan endotransglucosylase/hydrolase protein 31-like [Cucurbita pepo subsp. pepo]|uniref:xyloglucan endotransglucosylase/hydrolase protein 31-like n=1 Tax=Cucurbita pepo subsp. pepo TaxID=3664 RepID=UPI000C9D9502|nr:xyloglucan endotransglucosylase/hydrolase protein 31-like [Cucurbita pepo subsp. pepo]
MPSHSCNFMAKPSLFVLVFVLVMYLSTAQGPPPSPGYYPSSSVQSKGFSEYFANLWGPQHQRLDQGTLTIWLDKTSGSGYKSLRSYRSGYFGVSVKLQSGYTAGVITSFYLSNNQYFPGNHDEIDIEFLGTTPGKPYTLQTNVFIRGSGDGNVIGREMKFHLWFDPTQDFHHYAIQWTPSDIIFLVDDVPIRRYTKMNDATFPTRKMWIYGSIWDASEWATEDGKYKADYEYQPFVSKYRNFKISGCTAEAAESCRGDSGGMSQEQYRAMEWVQKNYLVYDYCHDPKRDRTQIPEC